MAAKKINVGVMSNGCETSQYRFRFLVALLSVKSLMFGIIQIHLILHSLTRNICSVGMTLAETSHINCYIIFIFLANNDTK